MRGGPGLHRDVSARPRHAHHGMGGLQVDRGDQDVRARIQVGKKKNLMTLWERFFYHCSCFENTGENIFSMLDPQPVDQKSDY